MKRKVTNVIPATKVSLGRDQVFSYLAPLNIKTKPGQLVQIPFGPRKIEGVVSSESQAPIPGKLKPINKIIDKTSVLTPKQIELARWLADYYMTSLGLVIKTMLPKRSVRPPKFVACLRKQAQKIALQKPANLKPAQQKALDTILSGKKLATLLHGVTGSGKTEVYLQAIATCLKKSQQAIVLIPEISLTPQTIERFTARFGANKVALLHSRLPYGKRYREWLRIRSEEAQVVIGPRSALFAPVQNLGIIVIDEEHETTYKQWDQHPRYHARGVAFKYSELTKAKLVLGSATPSLETFYQAQQGNLDYAVLPDRINKSPLPRVEIIDMRNELAAGNRSILSEKMQKELQKILDNDEQAILFLNRRGAATFVMCRDCGYVAECPNCSVSLTYHWHNSQKLLCHHCGYQTKNLTTCPKCQSLKIRYFGSGTQKVESEVNRLFPEAKVLRMDSDTTKTVNAHSEIFTKFARNEANILIGTQMIAKGFDLPNVALVGIISADTNLNFPDLRAHERTFQNLTQVAGRTGRRDHDGLVILQTYHPDNPAIKSAARHDYLGFYEFEMKQRKILDYPPFSKFTKLTLAGKSNDKIKSDALQLVADLKEKLPNDTIVGPASSLVEKKHGLYSWHILIKSQGNDWRQPLQKIKPAWSIDVDPVDLLS